jgi:hypothetical protein
MRPLEEVFEDATARFADVSALRCRALWQAAARVLEDKARRTRSTSW